MRKPTVVKQSKFLQNLKQNISELAVVKATKNIIALPKVARENVERNEPFI
jgi:hypothetical protein